MAAVEKEETAPPAENEDTEVSQVDTEAAQEDEETAQEETDAAQQEETDENGAETSLINDGELTNILDETADDAENNANEEESTEADDKNEHQDVEEEEEEDDDEVDDDDTFDPNVMPQVNVAILAKRRWQVKVYPLKPADFTSGLISKVFKTARESLLYLMTGKQPRGKGEMYIHSATESVKVVQNLMLMDSHFEEINVEIIKKNNEGTNLEKANMRFDTKMAKMLFSGPPHPPRYQNNAYGKKKRQERLIGSVFVKNLPPGTTKNMLRVMFPFAQEINYNPEKYNEGTARLVLRARGTVIPCLKAFAKIELGGNILELHPLEKKRPNNNRQKDAKKKEAGTESKSTTDIKAETKTNEDGKDAAVEKTPDVKKENGSPNKKPIKKDGEKDSKDKKPTGQQRRPGPGGPGGPKNKRFETDRRGPRPGLNARGVRTTNFAARRVDAARGNRMGGNIRSNYANQMSGIRNRGTGGDRRIPGLGASTSELMAKAEATKDMMMLQGQLNMAIKSQLAVLNQTQRAVQEAKRGASSLGLGSGLTGATASASRSNYSSGLSPIAARDQFADRDYLDVGRSRDRGTALTDSGSWSSPLFGKRTAAQADLLDDYDDLYSSRKYAAGAAARSDDFYRDSPQAAAPERLQRTTPKQQARPGQNRGQRGPGGQQNRGSQQNRGGNQQNRGNQQQNRGGNQQNRGNQQSRGPKLQARAAQQQSRALQQQQSYSSLQSEGLTSGRSTLRGYDDDLYASARQERTLSNYASALSAPSSSLYSSSSFDLADRGYTGRTGLESTRLNSSQSLYDTDSYGYRY